VFAVPVLVVFRLADEYDAAQDRGEVRKHGVRVSEAETAGCKEAGLTAKQIHEARAVRDAEAWPNVSASGRLYWQAYIAACQ
jgi:hypothetical protein